MRNILIMILLLVGLVACSDDASDDMTVENTDNSAAIDDSPATGVIAFRAVIGETAHQIYSVQLADNSRSQLTEFEGVIPTEGTFSPDGTQIAFVHWVEDRHIWVMNADGSDARQLTDGAFNDTHPTWSPDGTRIAFQSNRSNPGQIYAVTVASGELEQLTDFEGGASGPDWSPDGTKIAFVSGEFGSWDVYTLTLESGDVTQITSEEGRAIAFDLNLAK